MTKQIKHLALDSVDKTLFVMLASHSTSNICIQLCYSQLFQLYTQAIFNPTPSIFTTMGLQKQWGSPTICYTVMYGILTRRDFKLNKKHITLSLMDTTRRNSNPPRNSYTVSDRIPSMVHTTYSTLEKGGRGYVSFKLGIVSFER